MSKIGIMTFHTALNYGAVFQTYALEKFLMNMGHDVKVIDYRCPYTDKIYKPFYVSDGKYLNALVRGILFGRIIKKKRIRFNKFLENRIRLSQPIENMNLLNGITEEYDYFISGSDQVWSPISAGFDKAYFLPFATDEKKLSYAASIGATNISGEIISELKKRLSGFSCLSVREQSAKNMLEANGIHKPIYVHVDPTLLLQESDWKELCDERVIKEEYILIFNVEKPIKDIEFAKKYAGKNNLKIVYINDRTVKKDASITYIEAPTPEQFLSLFKNASLIVTNSFHGTVFSIIFKKNFYVELDNQKQYNVRVKGLLEELEIYNRTIDDCSENNDIDWATVDENINMKREDTLRYFNEVLEL